MEDICSSETLDAVRAVKLSRAELRVHESNRNAIALHEKFGFVTEGLERNALKVDGRHENQVLMALLFEG